MITTETNYLQNQDENTKNALANKNPTWEKNHILIIEAMEMLVNNKLRWPNITEIAEEAGLTRATVYKHLEEFESDELLFDERKELKRMSPHISLSLCRSAMHGDVKAMRLAYEIMGVIKRGKNINGPADGKV